jgi:hypothetical protein
LGMNLGPWFKRERFHWLAKRHHHGLQSLIGLTLQRVQGFQGKTFLLRFGCNNRSIRPCLGP